MFREGVVSRVAGGIPIIFRFLEQPTELGYLQLSQPSWVTLVESNPTLTSNPTILGQAAPEKLLLVCH